ncbi:MAG: type II toxin-antitoxin system RelE/ParE family toxin [Acidobacteria bacterium]|nr:type II toxin-antitoxin system RelE/ParE family toxin [Acidobacteriota bacterium]
MPGPGKALRVLFIPAAQRDVQKAVTYYHKEGGPALVDRFEAEVSRCTALAARTPLASPVVSSGASLQAHCKVLGNHFPYSLFFVVDDETLMVLSVAHHKRRSAFWASRLRGLRKGPPRP